MSKNKQIWPKLPPKFKEKWLEALRSGKYKQDKTFAGLLINKDKDKKETFCCLGVACRIMGTIPSSGDGNICEEFSTIKNIGRIPKVLRRNAGEVNSQLHDHLVRMNDNGKTFKVIADFIEKEL